MCTLNQQNFTLSFSEAVCLCKILAEFYFSITRGIREKINNFISFNVFLSKTICFRNLVAGDRVRFIGRKDSKGMKKR